MLQLQYWKEFWRLKVQSSYIELQLERTEDIDRSVKMVLALTSSASIGGWVIWKEFAPVWAAIIAVSQVLNAIRQYLPYKDRLRPLAGLLADLEDLVLQVEDKWLQIAAGSLTEEDIRKSLMDLRSKKMKSYKKHFPNSALPDNKGLLNRAESKTSDYFSHLYESKDQ